MQSKGNTKTTTKEVDREGLQELLKTIEDYQGGGLKEEATFVKDIAGFFDHKIASTIAAIMDAITFLDERGTAPVPLILEAKEQLISINEKLFDGSYEMVRIEEVSTKVVTSTFNDYLPIKVECVGAKRFNSDIWIELV